VTVKPSSSAASCATFWSAPLFARRRRDDPLLPPRLAERFVHPKVARQHLFEVDACASIDTNREVTLDDEGADWFARLRFRRRSRDCRKLVGEASASLRSRRSASSPFDGEEHLVDRVRPTAREDRNGRPRGRQLVERLEEKRRLAAPLVAVGQDEGGVVRLELRRPRRSAVFVALERDLAGGRDAQVRRGGVAAATAWPRPP
jgi:hypothetical protein